MSNNKIYKCCICHNELEAKPYRLVRQKWDTTVAYGRFRNIANYDFCRDCYKKFYGWIRKNNPKEA